MAVNIKQEIGQDLYILFEEGKLKYDISPFEDLTGLYVYATRYESDSLDYYIVEDDYTQTEEEGNNYINFVAGFPVDEFYSFKILDVKEDFDRVTSIVAMEDINPTTLNAEFNNIRDYMFLVQEILSKKSLRYDAEFSDAMLPPLNNGEFWIKTDTGFRATNFETLEAVIEQAFKDFFGIIGGEDETFTFEGVTSSSGDWLRTDLVGEIVDGIAIQTGDFAGTYYVMTSGFILIPSNETDDVGNPYVTDTKYYQSLTVAGGFSPISPVSGINKMVFKVIEGLFEGETAQYALILNYPHTIGDGTVSSEYIKYFNLEADMIADITLGLNQRVDINAELYKIVSATQPIALDNGLYAELLENIQVGTNKVDIEDRSLKTYTSIAEMGLTSPVTTTQIIEAMADGTVAQLIVGSNPYEVTDTPTGFGTLVINRASLFRTSVDFTDVSTTFSHRYEATYYNGTFSEYSRSSSEPVGIVNAYVGATAPTGWLICDGSTFSASTYPELNTLLGSNTLPDLRGEFIRGLDNGRGIDTGRTLLSSQTDLFKAHVHSNNTHIHGQPSHAHNLLLGTAQTSSASGLRNSGGTGGIGGTAGTTSGTYSNKDISNRTVMASAGGDNTYSGGGANTNSTGGTETRPRNIAMNYIIKAN